MGNMDRDILEDLKAAFSLLPEEQAREAEAELLATHARGGVSQGIQLKWSEHDARGSFLRGGASDLLDHSTRLVANSQEDPDIARLARHAREQGVRPGTLELLPEQDRFLWFLPYSPSSATRRPALKLRGLMVTEPLFQEVLYLLNPGLELTRAELRVIFQVTAGLTPREAAKRDGVSFETKRAHIKTASAKLHCGGQKDLVRKVLGQLMHLISVSEGEAVHAGVAEAFVARHLSEDVKLTARRLPGGRLLRVFECGPENGRPVVMLHGMMFPISLAGIARHLETAGLRLLVPIRPGFLESRPAAALAGERDLIGQGLADLAAYLKQANLAPAVVVGHSLGAVLAVRFANSHPEAVSQLALLSINLTRSRQSGDGYASKFYGGLKRLSGNPEIFRLVNWQFQKYYADRETARTILSRLFAGSEPDMAVLDGARGGVGRGTGAYPMFSDLYRSSIFGIAEDFDYVMNSWENEIRRIEKPITFLHGGRDPLTSVEEFRHLAAPGSGTRVLVSPEAGHFLTASDPEFVWSAVREMVR